MSMDRKTRKKVIGLSVTAVVLVALVVGGWLIFRYLESKRTVEVIPVSDLSTEYYGDTTYTYGQVMSDYVQQIYASTENTVKEFYVEQGQQVSIGDPLLQYDTTLLELQLETCEVAILQIELEIAAAQNQLKKLQNTKPASTPRPTVTQRPTVTPKPGTATATPTPTPIPPRDVNLYTRLDLNSTPYLGSGTTEDPYIFLCTADCVISPEFLRRLMGLDAAATPTPTPTPTPEPDNGTDDGIIDFPDVEAPPTPTPTPTPEPDIPGSHLASPFAAVFEVREGDSNHGPLLFSFKLDGTTLSGSMATTPLLNGVNTLETLAALFGATPAPNANNYNNMGYTAAELKKLIDEKKQEIKDLQLDLKQAKLDEQKAELALKNATVLSTVDGVVSTMNDPETALMANEPMIVVTGAENSYVSAALSENLLGTVKVEDSVSVFSYETGMSYSAQIVSIADYPIDRDNYYYYIDGNPNSSSYEFIAVLPDDAELSEGYEVEITIEDKTASSENIYLDAAYVREDDAGYYVMKSGIDNRLVKQYLTTGKMIYGASFIEVTSGLSINDYVAFPYGDDAKEGVQAVLQGTGEPPSLGGSTGGTVGDGVTMEGIAVPEMEVVEVD